MRDLGQELAAGTAEPKLAVRLSIKSVALLVDRAVVPATEHGEIRQRGGTALRPVTNVMALSEADPAAREAAAAVAVMERPPECRGNRPGASIDLHDPAVLAVSHHHPAGVARQTLRRSRGNARAVLEDRLTGLIGVGEDFGVDVD